jgi:hypothetical protein
VFVCLRSLFLRFLLSQLQSDGKGISAFLSEAASILVETFGNLGSKDDWQRLYDHLMAISGLEGRHPATSMHPSIISTMFQFELVNSTVLLFQALCPIRFAFIDGQARVVSVAYYNRKLLPTASVSGFPVNPLLTSIDCFSVSDGSNHRAGWRWSNPKTVTPASCLVLLARATHSNTDPRGCSENFTASLMQISKHRWEVSTSLCSGRICSQAISYTIASFSSSSAEQLDKRLENIPARMAGIFEYVVGQFSSFHSQLSRELFPPSPGMHSCLAKMRESWKKRSFPNVRTKLQRNTFPPGLFMLTMLVGCGLADDLSKRLLKDCISSEWKVPIGATDIIEGFTRAELHCGTYVGDVGDNQAWFIQRLYQVRCIYLYCLSLGHTGSINALRLELTLLTTGLLIAPSPSRCSVGNAVRSFFYDNVLRSGLHAVLIVHEEAEFEKVNLSASWCH